MQSSPYGSKPGARLKAAVETVISRCCTDGCLGNGNCWRESPGDITLSNSSIPQNIDYASGVTGPASASMNIASVNCERQHSLY